MNVCYLYLRLIIIYGTVFHFDGISCNGVITDEGLDLIKLVEMIGVFYIFAELVFHNFPTLKSVVNTTFLYIPGNLSIDCGKTVHSEM